MDNPYFVKIRSQLSVLHDTEMEQQHLENLFLKKKQETILVKIKKKWEKKPDILGDSTASEWTFPYIFNWQKRNNVKNAYKIKNCIREKDGDCS